MLGALVKFDALFLSAALTTADGDDPSGRYQVEGAPAPCTLRLQPSLPNPPQALVTGAAQSGFAFATPGCPAGLEALSLWRLELASETLTLVDEAGDVLLSASLEDGVWTGSARNGERLRLIRN
jgi:hypothetical protein